MDVCWQPGVTQQAAACFPSTKPLLILTDPYIQLIIIIFFYSPRLPAAPHLQRLAWAVTKNRGGITSGPRTPKTWEQRSAGSSDASHSLARWVLQDERQCCLMFWGQGKGRAPAGIIVAGNFRKSNETYFTMTLSTSDRTGYVQM